jgi:two-component system response regulator GlrR
MTSRLGTRYDIEAVDHAEAALDSCIRSRPNLVITDLHLASMDGLALLKELKSRWPAVAVIIVTACGTISEAVRATQSGAFGFLVKPVDKAELLGQVKRGIDSSTYTPVEGDWRSGIVARSQLMNDRLDLANRASASDIPVLLTGENGTGKELLARAIHASSARRNGPFIVVCCKDVDETTLEAELFGRRGPAAAGGHARGHGAIDAADGGTLLLEEIGCLPPTLQSELMAILRKTSAGAYGYAPPRVGPRLISTCSGDLQELMNTGEFRRDLYYQINILPIEIPPLGRRREDIPLLVSHFLEQATVPGSSRKIYTPDAIELLATTDWPGNVRQLFELVKQNVSLSHSKIMSKEFVERSLGYGATKVPTYDEAREAFARDYLTSNLQAAAGNISQAARLAKRNRTDFYKLLARYRVQPHEFKSEGTGAQKKAGEDG